MRPTEAIILAAGESARMVTDLPKVLHEVCGRPMLAYVLDACRDAGIQHILVVIGDHKESVTSAFADQSDITWVQQTEGRYGTGHAVMCCRDALADGQGDVVVVAGDMPLVTAETLRLLIETHQHENSAVTLATAVLDDPTGYGRIVRDAYGNLQGIVEHADCDEKQLQIKEVNPSYYCFEKHRLFEALEEVRPDNVKGEYYVTDALHILIHAGHRAVAVTAVAPEAAMGVNSREELANVSRLMQDRIQQVLMSSGVTIVDPPNTWIDARARIARDSVIHPFTYIHGRVVIGKGCSVGPFGHLRDGTVLKDGAIVGVFAEVKNSVLGEDCRARHHSYIGDAQIGARVNIGAGTIVANFDGQQVNPTTVEDDTFVGSGAILVAPLHLARGSHVPPGAIVNKKTELADRGDTPNQASS